MVRACLLLTAALAQPTGASWFTSLSTPPESLLIAESPLSSAGGEVQSEDSSLLAASVAPDTVLGFPRNVFGGLCNSTAAGLAKSPLQGSLDCAASLTQQFGKDASSMLESCAGLVNALGKSNCTALAEPKKKPVAPLSPALPRVCRETVSAVERRVLTSEKDLANLGVAAACARSFGNKDVAQLGFCEKLDKQLSRALSVGFMYALHPEEAKAKYGAVNPYALTTRGQFCDGFLKDLQASRARAETSTTTTTTTSTTTTTTTTSTTVAMDSAETTTASTPTLAPVAPATPAAQQAGISMLKLVQSMGSKPAFHDACVSLASALTSEEGSIAEEAIVGRNETELGSSVLMFNANDQAQIFGCADRLKVVAEQSGLLSHDSTKAEASQGAAVFLSSSARLQEVVDSPWAVDVCTDVAHSLLTWRVVKGKQHAETSEAEDSQFCTFYSQRLQKMREAVPTAKPVGDVQRLRKRHAEKLKRRAQQVAHKAPEHKEQLALLRGAQSPSAGSDSDGADFWKLF